jgi:hypothetical protein
MSHTQKNTEDGTLVGVIVVYYPEYVNTSISSFKRILDLIDKQHLLIIINNNKSFNISPNFKNIHIGSNSFAEFSGWQEGLDYARSKLGDAIRCVVFANDTFNHHRQFNFLNILAFASIFKKTQNNLEPTISGELCKLDKPIVVNSVKLSNWISTYLFCMNNNLLTLLNWKLIASNSDLDKIVNNTLSENDFFSNCLDQTFRVYLKKWLFCKKGISWYKADSLNDNNWLQFKMKTISIVLEKELSARALSKKSTFIDSNEVFYIFLIQKLKKFAYILRIKFRKHNKLTK